MLVQPSLLALLLASILVRVIAISVWNVNAVVDSQTKLFSGRSVAVWLFGLPFLEVPVQGSGRDQLLGWVGELEEAALNLLPRIGCAAHTTFSTAYGEVYGSGKGLKFLGGC
jgi:hypothetical protein